MISIETNKVITKTKLIKTLISIARNSSSSSSSVTEINNILEVNDMDDNDHDDYYSISSNNYSNNNMTNFTDLFTNSSSADDDLEYDDYIFHRTEVKVPLFMFYTLVFIFAFFGEYNVQNKIFCRI